MVKSLDPAHEVLLDVRPTLASGVDPFTIIMKTVKSMAAGHVLHLVNSFEPIPLYGVLGERGFEHWTEKVEGEWHIYFYKSENPNAAIQSSDHEPRTAADPHVIELDVRGLEPPEPMVRILEALSTVGENTILLVHHHREPMMLYDKLEQRGFTAIANKIEEGYYKVVIRKKRAVEKPCQHQPT